MAAFLVHVYPVGTDPAHINEDAEEFRGLVKTLGWELAGESMAPLRQTQASLYLGSGKAEEIAGLVSRSGARVLILDCALSPSQQRNWDRLTGVPVMDRQGLILEIFADRAQTREAQLQVGLARMEYLYPRLANSYAELSRQRGGSRNKGQGETQIEVDRRLIQDRIHRFKEMIEDVRAQRSLTRKSRHQQGISSVALVGYTNAGKSSLHRSLCQADTFVDDALFATLDPNARQCDLPGGKTVVMVDTVGFIRKLPHNLVDAFKATLEEASFADLLIHVIDLSSPWANAHWQATVEVLEEIGAAGLPVVLALNKIDRVPEWPDLLRWFEGRHRGPVVPISAHSGQGLPELLAAVETCLHDGTVLKRVQLGHRDGKIISWLYDIGAVVERSDNDHGPLLVLRLHEAELMRLVDCDLAITDA